MYGVSHTITHVWYIRFGNNGSRGENVLKSGIRFFGDKTAGSLGRGGFCERKGRRRTMEDQSVCMD